MFDLDNPRKKAIAAMKATTPVALWEENAKFADELRNLVKNHKVATHPAIAALNEGRFDKKAMQTMHLEYRHAIVQIFTDALLMAQHQSLQVEPRLAPGSKMYPRFLLTLNILDEFGFRPGLDAAGYYRGNPYYAHYPLFERVLDELGISHQQREDYKPSAIATKTREFLQAAYDDYVLLATLLAVAEEEVILFSPPLRQNTGAIGSNINTGYYYVHGTSEDDTAEAYDDDHEDDLWLVMMQAATPDRYDDLRTKAIAYCDLWVEFWDHQMRMLETATVA